MEGNESANSKAIADVLVEEIKKCRLDITKCVGFTSDGAAVMMGVKNGVAARLRQYAPQMINIHCICHKLALACTYSNESVTYVKDMELWLRQLWQYFENSPKRLAKFMDIQTQLKRIQMDDPLKKVVTKKLKKAYRTCLLSLESSVSSEMTSF